MDINIFSTERNDRKTAMKRHLITLLVAVGVNLIYWYIQTIGLPPEDESRFIMSVIMDISVTVVETFILMEASFAVSRLVIRSFWNVKYSFSSLLIQNIILLLSVVLISAAIAGVYALAFSESGWLSWDVFLCDCLVAYFLNSVFFTSFLTNRYIKEKEIAQQITIDKLKLKTDNHFVFNSLATLGNLIQTDQEAAIEFNNSMSKMYRYIVSKGDTKVVSLSEELSFVEEYRKNLYIGYANIRVDVSSDLCEMNSLIPPLSLQGLLENAVKHNRHGADNQLIISISVDKQNKFIVVSNNKLPLARNIESSKLGLDTLNERYRAICGKDIKVVSDENNFTVSLPIIKQSDLL